MSKSKVCVFSVCAPVCCLLSLQLFSNTDVISEIYESALSSVLVLIVYIPLTLITQGLWWEVTPLDMLFNHCPNVSGRVFYHL